MSPLARIMSPTQVVRARFQSVSGAAGSVRAPTQPEQTQIAPPAPAQYRPASSPQATIRQAEMLLQIVATNASSPTLRQIAAAAYQMEIDARREMAANREEVTIPQREWFA